MMLSMPNSVLRQLGQWALQTNTMLFEGLSAGMITYFSFSEERHSSEKKLLQGKL